MTRVSVLMSVFNESEEELSKAMESILNQSFSNFECIIVCDNPGNEEIKERLIREVKEDPRVKIIWNEANIGLALSLNKAFDFSQGEYIIRMDADDICMKDRFAKQIRRMDEMDYDLIWSSYFYIDEEGELIDRVVPYYREEEIKKRLPLENIVHHPTVIMKREAFVDAGKYRRFPCAQDYDLWLRMLSKGHRMYMMKEELLYYRVREKSTTSKRKFQQLSTLDYIRYIYNEKKKTGQDLYSYDHYLDYMENLGVGDKEREDRFFVARDCIERGKDNYSQGNYFKAGKSMLKGLMISEFYRRQILLYFKRKFNN